ncbi:MAG: response regulator [Candidatus Brocadiales bacterium]
MDKIRVLLADDHTIVREGLSAILKGENWIEVVDEAEDGRRAVEKTKELVPDVVVMDATMPLLNGFEATREILRLVPKTKVVVLTTQSNEEYLRQMLLAGASAYLAKKSTAADLIAAIRAVSRGETFFCTSMSKVLAQGFIRRGHQKGRGRNGLEPLSKREREVLQLVAEGHSNKEIADTLSISIMTVKVHKTNIMERLGIHSVAGLVKYAIQMGYVDVNG